MGSVEIRQVSLGIAGMIFWQNVLHVYMVFTVSYRQILLTAFSWGIHFDGYTILSGYFQDDDFACVHLGDRKLLCCSLENIVGVVPLTVMWFSYT